MDALRSYNLDMLRRRRYTAPESGKCRVFEIFAYPTQGVRFVECEKTVSASEQTEDNLFIHLNHARPDQLGEQATASLQLVRIQYCRPAFEIDNAENLFKLFDLLKIDPMLLDPMLSACNDITGSFSELTGLGALVDDHTPYNASFITPYGYLFWSYVPQDLSTRAVIFSKRGDFSLLPHLRRYSNLVYHPWCLYVAVIISSLNRVDTWMSRYRRSLLYAEEKTGYTPFTAKTLGTTSANEGLADLSKKVGTVATGMHDLQAQSQALKRSYEYFEMVTKQQPWHDCIPSSLSASVERAGKEIEAIGRAKSEHATALVHDSAEYISRANTQLNVVSHHISATSLVLVPLIFRIAVQSHRKRGCERKHRAC